MKKIDEMKAMGFSCLIALIAIGLIIAGTITLNGYLVVSGALLGLTICLLHTKF